MGEEGGIENGERVSRHPVTRVPGKTGRGRVDHVCYTVEGDESVGKDFPSPVGLDPPSTTLPVPPERETTDQEPFVPLEKHRDF